MMTLAMIFNLEPRFFTCGAGGGFSGGGVGGGGGMSEASGGLSEDMMSGAVSIDGREVVATWP